MDSIVRVQSIFSEAKIREQIEWVNYWLDNSSNDKRILLIGDSTSRMVRSTLEKVVDMPVDFIGSSSHMLDEFLLRQIEFFFEMSPYSYEMIHIQIGGHGIESMPMNIDIQAFYEDYKEQYRFVLRYLKSKGKIVIVGTTTQIVLYNNDRNPILKKIYNHLHSAKSEVPDSKYEAGIVRRNQIVKELAIEENVACNDLYNHLLAETCNMRHVDHVHYEKKSKKYIARKIAGYLK